MNSSPCYYYHHYNFSLARDGWLFTWFACRPAIFITHKTQPALDDIIACCSICIKVFILFICIYTHRAPSCIYGMNTKTTATGKLWQLSDAMRYTATKILKIPVGALLANKRTENRIYFFSYTINKLLAGERYCEMLNLEI